MTYPKVSTGAHRTVSSTPNFPEIEERVLAYWKDDDTFRASVRASGGNSSSCQSRACS